MHSEKTDLIGWLLAAAVVSLATYGALTLGHPAGVAMALALITLVVIERRRSKVITASLIRVTDENGGIRGLVAWDGEGVQIGVRADHLYNASVAYPVLWQKQPSIAFSFGPATSLTSSGEVIEQAPAIRVSGNMQHQFRSYAMEFSYEPTTRQPALRIAERVADGTVVRGIHLY